MHRKHHILLGQVFGDLTVISEGEEDKHGHRYYLCLCKCGVKKRYEQSRLVNGTCTRCVYCNPKKLDFSPVDRKTQQLYRQYINSAIKRRIPFELTKDEFLILVKSPCYYCGKFRVTRNPHTKEKLYTLNGVDRKRNSGGYTVENSVPCCTYCNQAKNNRDLDDFLRWVTDLYVFQVGGK